MPDSLAVEQLLQAAFQQAKALQRWPISTYRLQFHAGFTFRDATAIVPYLASLGITHVYASPYLAATAGSTHGYDVIDHSRLNPELGTPGDYDAWIRTMREQGLTHILDTVPNHVGVGTNDNPWWNDVLEHGPASKFAGYFDIDWQPACRPELAGKVLLPVLGKPYGRTLEEGELKLVFDRTSGRFVLTYFDRRFPLSPESYAIVSREIAASTGAKSELETLTHDASAGETIGRLKAAVENDHELLSKFETGLGRINGQVSDPRSFDALDAIIQAQHYRLADWHVAFDEINYRRFFDVNELAAIATEKERSLRRFARLDSAAPCQRRHCRLADRPSRRPV
ncbi:MAG: alpha-amylase family glycosyl hydrolase [Tepidisphaeraceae bacterium]